ncbi:5-formyltetrahydrofolate cyclo-ligase [Tautonia sp. JC769]|uniref:5-formyltetrahydrofolate cyclo-ligase n=1 Tax=Tautonia sp. JC769 TaxID=3232135 RepID=UPI00345A3470
MSNDPLRVAKTQMRRLIVDRILAMNPDDRARQEKALLERFPSLPGFDRAATVLLFVAHLPEEFPTLPLIATAIERGKTVACPRVDRQERRLRLYQLDDPAHDLVPGPFGIPEPKPGSPEIEADRIDWALIPGIAFDARGFRIGRGAGYYDRLLPLLRPPTPRLAMVLEPQWVDEIPTEPHDQPVHGVIGAERSWLSSALPAEAPPPGRFQD